MNEKRNPATVRDAVRWDPATLTKVPLLRAPLRLLEELGLVGALLGNALRWGFRRPYRWHLLVDSMEFIGVQSVFIVGLTALFVGMVFGIQLVDGFRQFGAENQTGAVVGLALARELSPVFAAMMVSSRAGSAMCTELGSMRVTHQIDALTALSVNPIQYLVVPRIIAGAIMVPVLTILFNLVGIFGAWLVCVHVLGLDSSIFAEKVRWYVDAVDVGQGMIKALCFGVAVTTISCRHGFHAGGGAAGVGKATTRAVVHSAVTILVLDYVITSLIVSGSLL